MHTQEWLERPRDAWKELTPGGATLQELVTPMLTIRWPRKAKKTGVVLKPITQITSLGQRVEIAPAAAQLDFGGGADERLGARKVSVKVCFPGTTKALMKGRTIANIEPGGTVLTVELVKAGDTEAQAGAELEGVITDVDNDEILERRRVVLKVELNEWD